MGIKNFQSGERIQKFPDMHCLQIRRMRVGDSRIRKEKVAASKISEYGVDGAEDFSTITPITDNRSAMKFNTASYGV